MEESIFEILRNFGSFGLALTVVGGAAWIMWKKVIEPQQKDSQKIRERHMETLEKMVERGEKFTLEHVSIEKENLKVLQELNNSMNSHNNRMKEEHKRLEDEIRQ